MQDIGFQPKADELPNTHVRQQRLQVGECGGAVHRKAAGDDARAGSYHVLRQREHAHDDVEGVGEDEHGDEGLENPLEDVESVELMRLLSRTFFKLILKLNTKNPLQGHFQALQRIALIDI